MKKKFILMALLFLGISFQSFAQHHVTTSTKADTSLRDRGVKGSILRNDPENSANNLIVSLVPVYVDLYSVDLNLGYNVNASYTYNNMFQLSGLFQGAYLDQLSINNSVTTGGVEGFADANGVKNAKTWDISATYFFLGQEKDIEEEMKLKETGNVTYVTRVPCKRYDRFGASLGIRGSNFLVDPGNGEPQWNVEDLSGNPAYVPAAGAGDNYYTMVTTKVLEIGLTWDMIHDLDAQFQGYGEKKAKYMKSLYAKFLYAFDDNYDDVAVYTPPTIDQSTGASIPSSTTIYNVNNSPKSRLGFCVGYHNQSLNTIGASWGVEFGDRPGPASGTDNLYLLLTFGISFSAHP